MSTMVLTIEVEREDDGRWIAEVLELPGAMAYGDTPERAMDLAAGIALQVLSDKIRAGEVTVEQLNGVTFVKAA